MKLKLIFAWTGIFVIGIIPVLLLLTFGPHNHSSITHTLGQVCGLIGMTLFAITFILSTRAKWIEDLFGGLDKIYPVHAILGATSFILLLLHPLFLVMRYIPANIKLAATYLLPGGLISVDFGLFALLGMIILLMITLYGKLKYNTWKFTHEFLGAFFILAILHIFLVRNTVALDNIFNGYYVYAAIVSIVGLGAFLYSLSRRRLFSKRYRIQKLNEINGCFEIILAPLASKDYSIGKYSGRTGSKTGSAADMDDNMADGITFKSGQFIFVKFKNKNVNNESHPFSIASAPGDGNIRIIVKNLGDFTGQLGKLREGNIVIVEGPYGRFHNNTNTDANDSTHTSAQYDDEVWVAGGIGITPFLGLAEDFRHNKTGRVDLYYSVKNRDEFVHLEELQDIAKLNKNFRVFPWVSNDQGYLNLEEIAKNSHIQHAHLKNHEWYLCGPASLKTTIRDALLEKNVKASKIHDERFAFK